MRALSIVMLILLVPCARAETEIQTPLEKADYTRLTSHADLMAYLKKLDAQSNLLSMSIIGKSVRVIVVVSASRNTSRRALR